MSVADFFKSLGDLFKSAKQREQEKTRARRQAFRRAERALDDVSSKLKELDKRGKEAHMCHVGAAHEDDDRSICPEGH